MYSSGLGKNPPPALDIRSRWTRSIITASGLSSAMTSSRWYETLAGQASTPTGTQRGRRDQRDLGAERVQELHVGARDPAVQHVADDRDAQPGQVAAR